MEQKVLSTVHNLILESMRNESKRRRDKIHRLLVISFTFSQNIFRIKYFCQPEHLKIYLDDLNQVYLIFQKYCVTITIFNYFYRWKKYRLHNVRKKITFAKVFIGQDFLLKNKNNNNLKKCYQNTYSVYFYNCDLKRYCGKKKKKLFGKTTLKK